MSVSQLPDPGQPSFLMLDFQPGLLATPEDHNGPTPLSAWVDAPLVLSDSATHFGFVHEGIARLRCRSGNFELCAGMYFAVRDATIEGGRGIVLSRPGFSGMFQLGGPIETEGRHRYIDGCTDSLLIPPVRMGDPCLNLLHIPPGTRQTRHTHTSVRAGLVVSGHGRCVLPERSIELAPGTVFCIAADAAHSFFTDEEALRVIAYHPDSDFGPTDHDHPMINRTLVNGVALPPSGARKRVTP